MEDRIKILADIIETLERAEREVREARENLAKIDAQLALSKKEYDIWHAANNTDGGAE